MLCDFRSDDYLCLHGNPAIEQAATRLLREWGVTATDSSYGTASASIEAALRRTSADFLGAESSMFFPQGFIMQGALFDTLTSERDAIVVDELVHGPIATGIRNASASHQSYAHRNLTDLKTALEGARHAKRRLVVTEGVFAIDGSIAPLPDIVELAERYDALLMVEDTHGIGVHGPSGAGTVEHYDLMDYVDVLVGVFNAEIGGGYASGSSETVDALQSRAHALAGAQTLSPALAAATLAGLEYVARGETARALLRVRARQLRLRLAEAGLPVVPGELPIVAVIVGDSFEAQRITEALFDNGILVTAFTAPTVPIGQAHIRLQVSVNHTEADLRVCVEGLVSAFAAL